MIHKWPGIRIAALVFAIGLFAGACGSDGVDAAPSAPPTAPQTTSAPTTTTSTTRPPQTTTTSTTLAPTTIVAPTPTSSAARPSPSEIIAFLGDSFTPELAECVAFGADDNSPMASIRAYIVCDRDSFLASMVRGMTDADPALISQLYGLSVDQADEFARCLTDEVLLLSTDQLLFIADETASVIEFGIQIGEVAGFPCSAPFVDALALDDAPFVDGAVRAIILDNDDWVVTDSPEALGGVRAVFVENDVVSIGLTVVDASDKVLWIDLLFSSALSTDETLGPTLIEVAAVFDITLDEATSRLLVDTDQDLEFGQVTICSTDLGFETYIEIVPTDFGCAHQLAL